MFESQEGDQTAWKFPSDGIISEAVPGSWGGVPADSDTLFAHHNPQSYLAINIILNASEGPRIGGFSDKSEAAKPKPASFGKEESKALTDLVSLQYMRWEQDPRGGPLGVRRSAEMKLTILFRIARLATKPSLEHTRVQRPLRLLYLVNPLDFLPEITARLSLPFASELASTGTNSW